MPTPIVFSSDRTSICDHRFRMPGQECPDCGESEGATQLDAARRDTNDNGLCICGHTWQEHLMNVVPGETGFPCPQCKCRFFSLMPDAQPDAAPDEPAQASAVDFRVKFSVTVAEADYPFCAMVDDRGDTYCDLSNDGLTRLTDIAEATAEPLFDRIRELEAQAEKLIQTNEAIFENMKKQAELVATLREALEAVEWVDQACPWCDGYKHEDGHASNCARQLALNPRGEKKQ